MVTKTKTRLVAKRTKTTPHKNSDGCNQSYIVYIKGRGKWIYKPMKGCRVKRKYITRGSNYKREVAAFLVSETLGFHFVPETYVFCGKHGIGSIQKWIQHHGNISTNHNQEGLFSLFDFVIGNVDRHSDNYLVDENGELVAIDNELSFVTNNYLHGRYYILYIGSVTVSQEAKVYLQTFLDNRKPVSVMLKPFLKKDEIQSMFQRAAYALQEGYVLEEINGRIYEKLKKLA